jgi:hypothetical protein
LKNLEYFVETKSIIQILAIGNPGRQRRFFTENMDHNNPAGDFQDGN